MLRIAWRLWSMLGLAWWIFVNVLSILKNHVYLAVVGFCAFIHLCKARSVNCVILISFLTGIFCLFYYSLRNFLKIDHWLHSYFSFYFYQFWHKYFEVIWSAHKCRIPVSSWWIVCHYEVFLLEQNALSSDSIHLILTESTSFLLIDTCMVFISLRFYC